MSRSGYQDNIDQKELAMWRGRVASATRGKRGQQLLRDCLAALDAMPQKRLIREELVASGDVCLLGAGAQFRGIKEIGMIDPEDHDRLGEQLNVAPCLIGEIEYVNDDGSYYGTETPEERWVRVRKWVVKQLIPAQQDMRK